MQVRIGRVVSGSAYLPILLHAPKSEINLSKCYYLCTTKQINQHQENYEASYKKYGLLKVQDAGKDGVE